MRKIANNRTLMLIAPQIKREARPPVNPAVTGAGATL
jgi:hypothetical protein